LARPMQLTKCEAYASQGINAKGGGEAGRP
jgi:hypothetical protein